MDVLVLGGTVFLGRAVVGEAVAAGHNVTVFNRGVSGDVPGGIKAGGIEAGGIEAGGIDAVRGDRTVRADLEQLTGRHFDLVVDTCGYVPAEVSMSADIIDADFYAFVSSINAYPGWPEHLDYDQRGRHDGNPDATRDDVPEGMDAYGWLKVGCELAVTRAFGPERRAILRGGLIVGPHDSAVGRLPWWLDRVARGGEVLVPGTPDDPVACIDARDLARFALTRVSGEFETPGPTGRDTRGDLMAACRAVTASDASFTYVEDEWLVGQGVQYWTEVPLWMPPAEGPATFRPHSAAAAAAGLTWRHLTETVNDTWRWQRDVPDGWQPSPRTPGLTAEREAELLTAWHARSSR